MIQNIFSTLDWWLGKETTGLHLYRARILSTGSLLWNTHSPLNMNYDLLLLFSNIYFYYLFLCCPPASLHTAVNSCSTADEIYYRPMMADTKFMSTVTEGKPKKLELKHELLFSTVPTKQSVKSPKDPIQQTVWFYRLIFNSRCFVSYHWFHLLLAYTAVCLQLLGYQIWYSSQYIPLCVTTAMNLTKAIGILSKQSTDFMASSWRLKAYK